MKQPESPQKQALGPLTFPVAAIEESAWAGGPWADGSGSFLRIFGAETVMFLASCSGMTSRVRGGAVHSLGSAPTSFLERSNRSLGFAFPPSNVKRRLRHSDGTLVNTRRHTSRNSECWLLASTR